MPDHGLQRYENTCRERGACFFLTAFTVADVEVVHCSGDRILHSSAQAAATNIDFQWQSPIALAHQNSTFAMSPQGTTETNRCALQRSGFRVLRSSSVRIPGIAVECVECPLYTCCGHLRFCVFACGNQQLFKHGLVCSLRLFFGLVDNFTHPPSGVISMGAYKILSRDRDTAKYSPGAANLHLPLLVSVNP